MEPSLAKIKDLSEIASQLDSQLKVKAEALLNWFKGKKKVIVALSGGVDSSVVAAFARLALGDEAVAVTGVSPTLAQSELEEAKKVAEYINIKHILLPYSDEANQKVFENSPNRCYYCRSELANLLSYVQQEGVETTLVDGGVLEDLQQRRPGVKALKEKGVRSPLQEIGLTKQEVRLIAKALGLPNYAKPSNSCLASRFPYGQRITFNDAKRVAESEDIIKRIAGVKQVRVRVHGDIARIEVGRDERSLFFNELIMDKVHYELRALGFKYVTLDLAGYRTGSLDEVP